MNRRKSIQTIFIGGFTIGVVAESCSRQENSPVLPTEKEKEALTAGLNRMKEEIAHMQKVESEATFFSSDEIATITILGDIIIPRDSISGSASDAKVPDFIEFIVKDMPEHQTPLRGGLRWLDVQCLTRYGKAFKDCEEKEKIEMIDRIAWPKKAAPDMTQGVSFFNLLRNLVATGFYTSEIGVKDVGYIGNVPNQWNGVPDEVLKQYNMEYSEKELKECISFS